MVKSNIGLQVDDFLPDRLKQQIGAGIGLIGAIETRDLVVNGLEGQRRTGMRGRV